MIKLMRNDYRRLNRPLSKKATGGDMNWGDITDQLNGVPKTAPVATTLAPNQVTAPDTSSLAPAKINTNSAPTIDTSTAPQYNPKHTDWGSIVNGVAPYLSNIANSFRQPPQPSAPHLDTMMTIGSPSFNNDRAEVSREINGNNAAADRTGDTNTAMRIRLFNQGQKLEKLSSINQQDHNMQLQARTEQARLNSGIQRGNNDKLDNYGNQQVERGIAQQRAQSENLSNAADKYVSINNEKRKAQVDLDKTRTMATLFQGSGVGDRQRKLMRDAGIPDPLGKQYTDIKKNGGMLKLGGTFYKGIPLRSQTIKSTYKPMN